MAANDPGLATLAAPGEETTKGAVVASDKNNIVEEGQQIAPDQFDERYETGRYEIWAYYAYYIGTFLQTVSIHDHVTEHIGTFH